MQRFQEQLTQLHEFFSLPFSKTQKAIITRITAILNDMDDPDFSEAIDQEIREVKTHPLRLRTPSLLL